ncbi:bifunctional hydroxymethylpyrimidine kinase/phosphomethylpyrimidine kinase [Leptospira kmetyi]|uniref:hydroxymethylpyrimidine kinase n=1 Tax=Leptospira kmetyi TaxID=408139 RepID=A0A5F1XPY6_9LEPT|nr:bifunctional hydroxymethylpyrimidine kinase/phosphomethylpyrimidine kinase [Leptospira kmetyi]AYV56064.1 bifunctional hydroxymethylpyrimidine kinase/phosphomethylpyrimidine kinase [Leptospira kmetyi]TGK16116.1 bifunctional hydroxymethylpyrimidine kinase/phosphomethylpyrimidine kinase [Leptospira kmetyi]TGK32146.1 bifunctional hydroxymethylpyrimidine kinase/phosphomethylpyrimidine kinase [Leptospira kmetyi]TGL66048.1 bifunctional hydroxymethylpyrimidine kinase/phosphomethylpyrimidine kinase [
MTEKIKPVTLTIAGSDSGGGAGIQADLKTFTALNTFGTSAITCLTSQNPSGVTGILEVDAEFLEKQILAVLDYFPVQAIKTGMLFSTSIIEKTSSLLSVRKKSEKTFSLVIDPVMVATSGAKLLQDSAIEALLFKLIPIADLITPNLDEAEILSGRKIGKAEEMPDLAKEIFEKFKVPILLKGGHLQNEKIALDILYDGKALYKFEKPFVSGFYPHGTGCTYSSAITSYLASGESLPKAVLHAKEYLHAAIEQAYTAGKDKTLNHTPKL